MSTPININGADVNTPSQDYQDMELDWKVTGDLFAGQRQMRNERTVYLPQEPGEIDEAYAIRLERTVLYNLYRKTVKDLTGKMFAKPITLDSVPKKIESYWENIDLLGNDGDTFFRNILEDGINHGLSYVLADYPTDAAGLNLAQQNSLKVRPYLKHILAEQVIRVVPAYVGGLVLPGRVHISEMIEEEDGDWGTKTIEQIRVLYPGSWEIWRKTENGITNQNSMWEKVDEGTTTLSYIPLYPFYASRTGFHKGTPPLMDLANLNVGHWQSSSDQDNIVHVARVPILFGRNIEEAKEDGVITIGTSEMIHGTDDSDLMYVEHGGKAIDAGRDAIKDLEDRMMVAAMAPMTTDSDTATSDALGVNQSSASAQDMALRLQDTINNALSMLCDWSKTKWGGSATVNRDFGMLWRDGSEIGVLLKSRQNGSISNESYLKELKRRLVLPDYFNVEAELKLLEEESELKQKFLNEEGKQVVGDRVEDDLDFGKKKIE
jgi:hypothetical protein